MDHKAGASLPVSAYNRIILPGMRRHQGGEGAASWESEDEFSVSSPDSLRCAGPHRGTYQLCPVQGIKNPRWYLGHETLFVYIAAGIVVVNWIYKNVMLVFFGIDLLPLWS